MDQNAGETGRQHADLVDPHRRRANQQCHPGTWEPGCPPIAGSGASAGEMAPNHLELP